MTVGPKDWYSRGDIIRVVAMLLDYSVRNINLFFVPQRYNAENVHIYNDRLSPNNMPTTCNRSKVCETWSVVIDPNAQGEKGESSRSSDAALGTA